MRIFTIVCIAAAVSTLSAAEPPKTAVQTAQLALRRAEPSGLTWKHSQSLDVNCDGVRDEVFTAADQSRFYVGVVLGPVARRSQYSVVAFALAGDSQNSFCDGFQSLKPEALISDMADATGEEPLGYRASRSCKGLRLDTGECDPFHLFWNHMSNALDWWRL